MTKLKLKIKDMHCSSCAISIDFDLEDIEGIESAKTSYAKQECAITYDDTKVDLEKVLETIKNTGYTAVLSQ